MSFLDIKDPAERATLVKEYVTAIKPVKQRHMVNREMKLAIGDELQTPFSPIVNVTKQAAEETRKELALMKQMLTDIDGALAAQRATDAIPRPDTFGLYRKQDGQLGMGNKAVRLDVNGKTLTMDDIEYKITPGLEALIALKHPRSTVIIKTAMRGTLDAAKRAVPHLIAHKVASTIGDAAKKRKGVDIDAKHSQEPQCY